MKLLTFIKYIYGNSNNKSNVKKINIATLKNDKKHLTIHVKSIINPNIYIYKISVHMIECSHWSYPSKIISSP